MSLRLSKNKQFKVEEKSSLILINDKPTKLKCDIVTKQSHIQYVVTNKNTRFKNIQNVYNKFLKLGSVLKVYDVVSKNDEELILTVKRDTRGKVTVSNNLTKSVHVYKVDEFVEQYKDFLSCIFNGVEFETSKKEIVKKKEVPQNTNLVEFMSNEVEKDLSSSQNKVFALNQEFTSGRKTFQGVKFSVKHNKPSIEVLKYDDVYTEISHLYFGYKKGNRKKVERLSIAAFKPIQFINFFKNIVNQKTNSIEVHYFNKETPYVISFFTIEYVLNKFLFSYTLSNEKNHETIYFLEVKEDTFIQHEEYALHVIASLFGKTEKSFIPYLQEILINLNKNRVDNYSPTLKTYHEWAEKNNFVLEYLDSYPENEVKRAMDVVIEGIDKLKKVVNFDDYKPLYKLAIQNTNSFYGFYFHASSKLSFSLKLFNRSKISTVYHEYGHLIYYSLMNKQIHGENVARENKIKLEQFLKDFKNCSYIRNYVRKDIPHKLSYYREDTELFARLFETFMAIQTGEYEELCKTKKTLNSKDECILFVDFVNKAFDMNLSFS